MNGIFPSYSNLLPARDDARLIFARRLKEARLAAGLTQAGLGILAGIGEDVASTRVNRYERGVNEVDIATARALAKVLGVPLASLYAETPVMAKAIAALAKLPSRELERIADELVAKTEAAGQKRRTRKTVG